MSIVVRDVPLSERWAPRAAQILAVGDKERHFNAPHRFASGARGIFAFEGIGTGPENAQGVLVYVVRTKERRRVLLVELLYVLEPFRKKGAGLAMLTAAYDAAVRNRCLDVQADVRPFNYPMLRLMERAGYDCCPREMWKSVKESRSPEGEFF